jgi:hypothetical protein
MFVIQLCFRHQQTRLQIFGLTQLYIYYDLATCFGPYLDHHKAVVDTVSK